MIHFIFHHIRFTSHHPSNPTYNPSSNRRVQSQLSIDRISLVDEHDPPDEEPLFAGKNQVPSGKQPHNYGQSPFLMEKLAISMAIFNSYVSLPEGKT